jgi:hypothetical protein
MSRKAVLERVLGKNNPQVAKEIRSTRQVTQAQITPAMKQLDAAFNALLQEIIEPLVIKELHASLEQLKEDRRLRAEGKGMAIFVVNKPKDLKKIDGLIKAMQTVVSYYSRPF